MRKTNSPIAVSMAMLFPWSPIKPKRFNSPSEILLTGSLIIQLKPNKIQIPITTSCQVLKGFLFSLSVTSSTFSTTSEVSFLTGFNPISPNIF